MTTAFLFVFGVLVYMYVDAFLALFVVGIYTVHVVLDFVVSNTFERILFQVFILCGLVYSCAFVCHLHVE